jgi:hypothetical protein
MAGCIPIRRKEEFTPTSRLQRLSATLIVFSEASENPAAWVFFYNLGFGLSKRLIKVIKKRLINK